MPVVRRCPIVLFTLALGAFAGRALAQTGPPPSAPATPDYSTSDPALAGYLARALDRNPSIKEAQSRYAASLQVVPQAMALPDPMAGATQAIRSVETRVGPQFETFTVSQTFPWFGKRGLRGDVAKATAAVTAEQIAVEQWNVIVQVKQTYYELAYVDAALRVTGQERALLEQYERLAESRYASGQGLQQAVIKMQAEITKIMSRQQTLQQQRVSLAARLNSLMDDPPARPIDEIADLTVTPATLDRDVLVRLGDSHRPELAVTSAAESRGDAAITLARTSTRPDFTLSAGYINVGRRHDAPGVANPPPDNGKNAFTVSFMVNVPIRRAKYDAAIEQAARDRAADAERTHAARNAMTLAIEDQLARIHTLADQLTLFERALVPQSEEALRSTESAYTTGQTGVVDLLDSERVLLDVRLVIARQRSDYLVALAVLERAIGTRLPEE